MPSIIRGTDTFDSAVKVHGFKNHIINGKKAINQRGLTSTDNSYNQDRWYKAGNNWYQGIEELSLTTGKIYTISWTGSATAGYYVGTATSATINAQTFIPITNGGSFTLTISSGQNLWVKFSSNATGSTFTNVQLEEGSVATPFEQRPYGLELSLCQRYFQKFLMAGRATSGFFSLGRTLQATMRRSPDILNRVFIVNETTEISNYDMSVSSTEITFNWTVTPTTTIPFISVIHYLSAEL